MSLHEANLVSMITFRPSNQQQTFVTISYFGPMKTPVILVLSLSIVLPLDLLVLHCTAQQTKKWKELQSGALGSQISDDAWLKKVFNSQAWDSRLVWQGVVLLPCVGPPCSYYVDLGFHPLAQKMETAVSVQLWAFKVEVGWYDIAFTADDTKDHNYSVWPSTCPW